MEKCNEGDNDVHDYSAILGAEFDLVEYIKYME